VEAVGVEHDPRATVAPQIMRKAMVYFTGLDCIPDFLPG